MLQISETGSEFIFSLMSFPVTEKSHTLADLKPEPVSTLLGILMQVSGPAEVPPTDHVISLSAEHGLSLSDGVAPVDRHGSRIVLHLQ